MDEALIFIGLTFWLVYFATTFENVFLKVTLKLVATLVAFNVAYITLIPAGFADFGTYETFVWVFANGIRLFWVVWGIVLIKEVLELLADRKEKKFGGSGE